jgi:hypothetical protein
MTDNTSKEQYRQGLQTIHSALMAALDRKGVRNAYISYAARGSGPRDTTFSVTANRKAEELMFTREEIADSARSIDSFAAAKVRVLASRFAAKSELVDSPIKTNRKDATK